MSLLSLPNELLFLVAGFLDPKNLNAFLQTNRFLSLLLTPLLHSLATQPHDDLPPLHWATVHGHQPLVKLLLKKGLDVDARCDGDKLGKNISALHYAAHTGHLEIAKLLLGSGADVNAMAASGGTPLYFADNMSHEPVVMLLKENGGLNIRAHTRSNAFETATREGQEDVVRFLIDRGFDVNLRGRRRATPLHWAAMFGQTSIAKLLLDNGAEVDVWRSGLRSIPRGTALHWALQYSRCEETVRLLLARGADPNLRNYRGTVLHVAARWGCERQIALLLEKADITARNNSQETPIQVADRFGRKEIVRLILMKGMELGVPEIANGVPALHFAAGNGLEDLTKEILSSGVDVNIMCVNGRTALIQAATRGYSSVVKLLLEHGANGHLKDNTGCSAFHYAIKNNQEAAAHVLAQLSDIQHDSHGTTLLLLDAARKGNARIIKIVLDAFPGIDVDCKGSAGETMLHLACGYGRAPESAIELLLEKGASTNTKNLEGNTPLHEAAISGCVGAARILLKGQADAGAQNNNGETALDIAVKYGVWGVAELFPGFVKGQSEEGCLS